MMKTSRVDVSSRGERTKDDALAYLKTLKDTMFQDKKENYDEFLKTLKAFKQRRIDRKDVIARVKDLLKGHDDLILGFNTFLPKEYQITIQLEDQQQQQQQSAKTTKPLDLDETLSFVVKVKTRFRGTNIYESFLEILIMYAEKKKLITDVYLEVAELFKDHADLFEEFTRFLPPHASTTHAMVCVSLIYRRTAEL